MKLVKWAIRLVLIAAVVIAVQTAAVTARSSTGSTEGDVRNWATLFTQKSTAAAKTAANLAIDVKDAAVNAVSSHAG